ncbi:MAG: GGDEF domain-containing protein [Terriglobales bacterium]
MDAEPEARRIPSRAIVESWSEPTPDLFLQHVPALTNLLRLALLSGTEMTLPTTLQLVLDLAPAVVASEQQMMVFAPGHRPAELMVLSRGMDTELAGPNLLHAWVGRAGKPVVVCSGLDGEMDGLLEHMQARTAAAVPLFLQHGWAGSLQMFRVRGPEFSEAEARLLWILSLLAENQMAAIESLQQLTRLAFTDYLTGLKARGYFERTLEQELHRSVRRNSACGLLLLDLDDFKAINDRYGHHAGDEVLRQFACVLPHGLREVDTVARFGGDEFVLILPDISRTGMRLVEERLEEHMGREEFTLPEANGRVKLSLSMGAALCPEEGRDPQALLRAADRKLYQAKRHRSLRRQWDNLRRAG